MLDRSASVMVRGSLSSLRWNKLKCVGSSSMRQRTCCHSSKHLMYRSMSLHTRITVSLARVRSIERAPSDRFVGHVIESVTRSKSSQSGDCLNQSAASSFAPNPMAKMGREVSSRWPSWNLTSNGSSSCYLNACGRLQRLVDSHPDLSEIGIFFDKFTRCRATTPLLHSSFAQDGWVFQTDWECSEVSSHEN